MQTGRECAMCGITESVNFWSFSAVNWATSERTVIYFCHECWGDFRVWRNDDNSSDRFEIGTKYHAEKRWFPSTYAPGQLFRTFGVFLN